MSKMFKTRYSGQSRYRLINHGWGGVYKACSGVNGIHFITESTSTWKVLIEVDVEDLVDGNPLAECHCTLHLDGS